MNPAAHQNGWAIVLSFIAAFALAMIPLPFWLEVIRPEWVTLVLIYWCLALPHRVSVGMGWLAGMLLDVARGAVLGQHALALAVVAFLVVRLHQRMRLFPIWQQAISVLLLVVISELFIVWIRGMVGHPGGGWMAWLPAFTSMLIWPVVFSVLRGARRRFKVR